jgi:hypothetical protein
MSIMTRLLGHPFFPHHHVAPVRWSRWIFGFLAALLVLATAAGLARRRESPTPAPDLSNTRVAAAPAPAATPAPSPPPTVLHVQGPPVIIRATIPRHRTR